ncbi:MAG: hypothetical protein WBG02_21415 [Candidatus Acidiferrum sp.]
MKIRILVAAVVVTILLATLPRAFRAQSNSGQADPYLTVHEWGTFTSIAGRDGRSVEWMPLDGSTDLPSFVEHFSGVNFKAGLRGTVRMETPVLYFYTNRDTTVSVNVSLSKGLITEWYPHASRVYPVAAVKPKYASFPVSDWALSQSHPDGSIAWDGIELQPRGFVEFLEDKVPNHYYAARQTGSTALQMKTVNGTQSEKFLFYRGVSTFVVPISASIRADGGVLPENLADQAIPAMLLFERRGDRLGFRVAQQPANGFALNPPELNGDMNSLKQTVVDMLVAQGLFQDEAQAMFETWRDSWFEEGSRLFYIVPRSFVDSILRLTIQPAPSQIVRVFVGRVELVTPATRQAIEQAVATHDDATLSLYSRFLTPILQTTIAMETDPVKKAQLTCYRGDTSACAAQISQNSYR